ncbi:carboxymuconolactone decarboxylase family protein, partial [Rhizobium ruizarguesonis]
CDSRHAFRSSSRSSVSPSFSASWRESQLFTTRERAELAWAEALTQIAKSHEPDDVYEEAHANFSDDELVALSIGVA